MATGEMSWQTEASSLFVVSEFSFHINTIVGVSYSRKQLLKSALFFRECVILISNTQDFYFMLQKQPGLQANCGGRKQIFSPDLTCWLLHGNQQIPFCLMISK